MVHSKIWVLLLASRRRECFSHNQGGRSAQSASCVGDAHFPPAILCGKRLQACPIRQNHVFYESPVLRRLLRRFVYYRRFLVPFPSLDYPLFSRSVVLRIPSKLCLVLLQASRHRSTMVLPLCGGEMESPVGMAVF